MWTNRFLWLLAAAPLWGHAVSMSTGELRISGSAADYELRIPMYEVVQMADPATILDYLHLDGGHRTSAKCADEEGTFVCHASYSFEQPMPDQLSVECRFFAPTVPNHVHWLHAVSGAGEDQEVFDEAFPRTALHFRKPSMMETFGRKFGLGVTRAAMNAIGLLFLLGLAMAAPRSGIPFLCFLTGELVAIFAGSRVPWPMAPRFLDAAMALTVAYLAVEILMHAEVKHLAWIVAILGLFHGLAISGFPISYSAGAAVLQMVAFLVLAFGARYLSMRWKRVLTWCLLAAGVGLFAVKMIPRV